MSVQYRTGKLAILGTGFRAGHIRPPESGSRTTQCRLLSHRLMSSTTVVGTQSSERNSILRFCLCQISWDSEGCLTPAESVHTKMLRKYEGIYCLIFKFKPCTKGTWWTLYRSSGGIMLVDFGVRDTWVQTSALPPASRVTSLLWVCFLVMATWGSIYILPET